MSQRLELPAGTLERLTIPVSVAPVLGTAVTTYTVAYALIAPATVTPAAGDWVAATWASGGPPYIVLALVTKTAGAYRLWLRITTPDEVVLRRVAIVEFT